VILGMWIATRSSQWHKSWRWCLCRCEIMYDKSRDVNYNIVSLGIWY
jgi:hypothetical protein